MVAVRQTVSTAKDVDVNRHIQILPVPELLRIFARAVFVTGFLNFVPADEFPLRAAGILDEGGPQEPS